MQTILGSFEKQSRGIMSPKMDYEEWTPLGRGDPLKNDPTFDYSPPMLGKVKYWISPLLRTPDPPIVPIKELTTETSQITATITSSTKTQNPKQSTDIKRFYIDFKDPSDMSYVQLMNTKYNNKFVRPQQQHVQYQNHYYNPTRPPPPPPLPMLVPPPPVEPNSYSKNENSTTLALPWHFNKTQLPSTAATISYAASTNPPAPKTFATPKPEIVAKTEIPFLKLLLDKETSESYHVTNPTTLKPLTPNPMHFTNKYSHPSKSPQYLIIQGHSKVKQYGAGKIDRSDNVVLQDTNDIGEPMKYELPKEMRGGKQLGVEDFLPFDGIIGESLKDFVSSQAEGSGFGAELTRVMFPSYIRPTPTPQYESPRRMQQDEDEDES